MRTNKKIRSNFFSLLKPGTHCFSAPRADPEQRIQMIGGKFDEGNIYTSPHF